MSAKVLKVNRLCWKVILLVSKLSERQTVEFSSVPPETSKTRRWRILTSGDFVNGFLRIASVSHGQVTLTLSKLWSSLNRWCSLLATTWPSSNGNWRYRWQITNWRLENLSERSRDILNSCDLFSWLMECYSPGVTIPPFASGTSKLKLLERSLILDWRTHSSVERSQRSRYKLDSRRRDVILRLKGKRKWKCKKNFKIDFSKFSNGIFKRERKFFSFMANLSPLGHIVDIF